MKDIILVPHHYVAHHYCVAYDAVRNGVRDVRSVGDAVLHRPISFAVNRAVLAISVLYSSSFSDSCQIA